MNASPDTSRSSWIIYNATVFIAAACVMTVEILSTRLVARYLGSSLYTWTSAIGIVLAGISLGNYLGGRLADRPRPRRTLSVLFFAAAAACMTIPVVNGWIGRSTLLADFSWPVRIFWHFTLVFLLPSTLLGTMSPVVAKMALDMGRAAGRTVGTIYAWGAIGSIVGTFASGFFLVAWMGTERAILVVSAVLAIVGVMYGARSWFRWGAAALLGLGVVLVLPGLRDPDAAHAVFMEDSLYQRVLVMDGGGERREMVLDLLVHSKIDLARPLDLQYEYEIIYAEVMRRCVADGTPVSALFLGGGGYVFPRYVERTYPGGRLEVVEIDPVVTRAAYEAFGLPRDTDIVIHHQDARQRVADLVRAIDDGSPAPGFDFVFGDAFNDFSVPYHLTTVEFDRHLGTLMSDDGVYMLNVVDALDSGLFLAAVVRTCGTAFPHVRVFGVGAGGSTAETFVVVASRRPLPLDGLAANVASNYGFPCTTLGKRELDTLIGRVNGVLLTDDFAPVENLLAPVIRRRTTRARANDAVPPTAADATRAEIAAIESMLAAGRMHDAATALAAATNPGLEHGRLNNSVGQSLATMGDLAAAREAFVRATTLVPQSAAYRSNLGLACQQLGRSDEAIEHYRQALTLAEASGNTTLATQIRSELSRALHR